MFRVATWVASSFPPLWRTTFFLSTALINGRRPRTRPPVPWAPMPPEPLAERIASLDQFRGYTVLGMFAVNFLGNFAAIPEILKHHADHVTYADTIMPGFFFAAGFSYRLTFLRRLVSGVPPGTARIAALRRSLGLILIGIIVYHLDGRARTWAELESLGLRGFLAQAFQRDPFQALVHIGV